MRRFQPVCVTPYILLGSVVEEREQNLRAIRDDQKQLVFRPLSTVLRGRGDKINPWCAWCQVALCCAKFASCTTWLLSHCKE